MPQGLKARVDFACVIPAINPRPSARTSFSTACDSPNAWSDVETAWALRSCGFALSVFRVTRCGESICNCGGGRWGFVFRGLGGVRGVLLLRQERVAKIGGPAHVVGHHLEH